MIDYTDLTVGELYETTMHFSAFAEPEDLAKQFASFKRNDYVSSPISFPKKSIMMFLRKYDVTTDTQTFISSLGYTQSTRYVFLSSEGLVGWCDDHDGKTMLELV